MIYGKYCPSYKDGYCLGSAIVGNKLTRCEDINIETLCAWYEEAYVQSLKEERPQDKIKQILTYYLSQTHCATCTRLDKTDARCYKCESYWELDEYTLGQIVDKIMKAIEE